MSNHPNRSKAGSEARNPTPNEVRQAREELQARLGLGITEAQELCAKQVHTTCRTWQQWETDADIPVSHRRMHPAFWELFNLKKNKVKKP